MEITLNIIETARKLRESKKITLKQPIMSLTIINNNENLLAELQDFLPYIEEEINVDKIYIERDVEKYVQLTCQPNHPVIGPKFKEKKGLVVNAIQNLTQ